MLHQRANTCASAATQRRACVYCNNQQRCTVLYCIVCTRTVARCTVLYYIKSTHTILCQNTVLYLHELYCTVPYRTVLYCNEHAANAVLYCTVRVMWRHSCYQQASCMCGIIIRAALSWSMRFFMPKRALHCTARATTLENNGCALCKSEADAQ